MTAARPFIPDWPHRKSASNAIAGGITHLATTRAILKWASESRVVRAPSAPSVDAK